IKVKPTPHRTLMSRESRTGVFAGVLFFRIGCKFFPSDFFGRSVRAISLTDKEEDERFTTGEIARLHVDHSLH
ncbi:hypothetical protein PMAYCL1PPCAC_15102, partial [Pristionchus mayeri]